VIVSVRQQGGQVDLVGLARAVAAGVSLPVVGDAVGIVDQGRTGAAGNGEFSGPDEAVAAPAAGQDVVAPPPDSVSSPRPPIKTLPTALPINVSAPSPVIAVSTVVPKAIAML